MVRSARVKARGRRIVDRSRQLAEVTGLHERRRQGVEPRQLAAAQVKLVPGEEPEGLVAAVVEFGNQDGAAQRSAPLVLFCRRPSRVEESAGIEHFVAQEIEARAMQAVGAALHGETRDGAHRVRILGRVVVGDELELLDRIDRRVHLRVVRQIPAAERDSVVIGHIGEGPAAADRFGPRAARVYPGRELDEARRVADAASQRERQFEEALRLDHEADVGALGLNQRSGARDRHRLSHLADRQADVDGRGLVDLHLDVLHYMGLEAGHGGGHRVPADGKREETIHTGGRRYRLGFEVRALLHRLDRTPGNDSAARISYHARNRTTITLGEKRYRGKEQHHEPHMHTRNHRASFKVGGRFGGDAKSSPGHASTYLSVFLGSLNLLVAQAFKRHEHTPALRTCEKISERRSIDGSPLLVWRGLLRPREEKPTTSTSTCTSTVDVDVVVHVLGRLLLFEDLNFQPWATDALYFEASIKDFGNGQLTCTNLRLVPQTQFFHTF